MSNLPQLVVRVVDLYLIICIKIIILNAKFIILNTKSMF